MSTERYTLQNTLDLVERCQSNDEAAAQALFARYLPRVRRMAAVRLGRSPSELLDVDDVSQDAMIDAFGKLERFDITSDGKFCNWLAKIVENRIRMTLRDGKRLKRGGGKVRRFSDNADSIHQSHLAGADATPSQHATGNELNERFEQALLQVSERQRELVLLRYYAQMSYEEIAEAMEYESAAVVRVQSANLPLYGMSDVLTVSGQATVQNLGTPCSYDSHAFRFVPNGAGGHDVFDAGNNAFDPDIGSLAGASENDLITATGLDLGFAFPFPTATGTAPEQFVRIDPNGRILPESSGVTIGDPTPTKGEFFTDGFPMICPFWCDFDATNPNSDGIYFKTQPGSATFTWNAVTENDPWAGQITVQCTLFPQGEVLVVLEYMNILFEDYIVGISSGNVAGSPAAIDLSHTVSGSPASGAPAYEFFGGDFDLSLTAPVLSSNYGSRPVLGTTFRYYIDRAMPYATIALYLVGTNLLATPVPLTSLGFAAPCSLSVQFLDIQVRNNISGAGYFAEATLSIPAAPTALIGFELYIQGMTDGADYGTPVMMTNTLRATIGDQ